MDRNGLDLNGIHFSNREWQIAKLLGEHRANKDIAEILHLSEGTVKMYMYNLFTKVKEAKPELRDKSIRSVLGSWARCYECGRFRDHGADI
jgi:DNA-binding NarL/FixJ family response regulator